MKHTYAFLAVLVFATSTGSAKLVRLVAKQELSFAGIKIIDGNIDEFNNFYKTGAGFRSYVYSSEVEVAEGEALRPLQLNQQEIENVSIACASLRNNFNF